MALDLTLPKDMTFEQYASSGWRLYKVDKNGTHYYSDRRCPKCGGKGYIYGYEHVSGGICFMCGGTGQLEKPKTYRVLTPEYAAKLAEKRLAKAIKEAPEKNAKAFKAWGLSEQGHAYIVMGDTFGIKDALKKSGARWSPIMGWYFDHEQDAFTTYDLAPDTLITEDEPFLHLWADGHYSINETHEIQCFLNGVRDAYTAEHTTLKHIGSVGDKLNMELTLERTSWYETHFGYRSQTVWVYTFADAQGNQLVWKTQNCLEVNEGSKVEVAGTVKEHSEYKGKPQTVLTRCKVKKIA